jgi:hypothetical protein
MDSLFEGEEDAERIPRYGRRLDPVDTDSFQPVNTYTPISSSNKGHKMLKMMGWVEGEGLGKEGQGKLPNLGLP